MPCKNHDLAISGYHMILTPDCIGNISKLPGMNKFDTRIRLLMVVEMNKHAIVGSTGKLRCTCRDNDLC